MKIIKLTHAYEEKTCEVKIDYKWYAIIARLECKTIKKWDKHPTFHSINGCTFRAASAEIEGRAVKGSLFNGSFVKETPEEILKLIEE